MSGFTIEKTGSSFVVVGVAKETGAKRIANELSAIAQSRDPDISYVSHCVKTDNSVVAFIEVQGALISVHFPSKYPFRPFSISLERAGPKPLSEILHFGICALYNIYENLPVERHRYFWSPSITLHKLLQSDAAALAEEVPDHEMEKFQRWPSRNMDLYCQYRQHKELFTPSYYPEEIKQGIRSLPDWALEPSFVQLVIRTKEFLREVDRRAPEDRDTATAAFLDLLKSENIVTEDAYEIYSFPMFTREFCGKLLEEKENYYRKAKEIEGLEIVAPNSMNNYGLIVDDIGMECFMSDVRMEYILPVSKILFPKLSSRFDSHHAFIVSYEGNKDTHLDMHHDAATVTWNICLGKEGFVGSGLTFCGNYGSKDHRKSTHRYHHEIGRCVVHDSKRRHGADVITGGERHNLIIWNKNSEFEELFSTYKRSPGFYKAEEAAPDVECVSYTHDRDFIIYKHYPAQTIYRAVLDPPWCPPVGSEYEGFPSRASLDSKMKEAHDKRKRLDSQNSQDLNGFNENNRVQEDANKGSKGEGGI